MKKLLTITLVMLLSISGFSQEDYKEIKTLFSRGKLSHGAYAGFSVNYTQIDDKDGLLIGARAAWIIDHGLAIGFVGQGFANDIYFDDIIEGETHVGLAGGYGGLLIEPIIFPNFPVHISVPILIGAGGVSYIDDYYYNDQYGHYDSYDTDAFFVVEPGIELELNLVKFIRLGAGAYYRHTSDIHLINTDKDVLNGFSTGISLKFGKF